MKNQAHAQTVVLGLGSNLGDRLGYLSAAVDLLVKGSFHIFQGDIVLSPIYESPALLLADAPDSWNIPFYNMAIMGKSAASPQLLLHTVKKIELLLGRKDRGRWAPREIDIDILAIEHTVVAQDSLAVPHPALLERDFAFLPFADIYPGWRYPLEGSHHNKTIREIITTLPQGSAVRTDLSWNDPQALAA